MNKVIYNIGYSSRLGNSGVLTWYPHSMDCTFSEFAQELRKDYAIKDLFDFAEKAHVIPSSIILMILIEDEEQYWEYTVKMINVREYRKYWETKYKKKWKEN